MSVSPARAVAHRVLRRVTDEGAFADEAHQSVLASRTGSARDFLIDAFAATLMLTIARGRQTIGDRGGPLGGAIAAEPAD